MELFCAPESLPSSKRIGVPSSFSVTTLRFFSQPSLKTIWLSTGAVPPGHSSSATCRIPIGLIVNGLRLPFQFCRL